MLKYKDFFRELLTEEQGVSLQCDATFDALPDRPPYGFLILPDGKFGVARCAWDHEELAGDKYQHSPWKVMERGGARIVKSGYDDKEYLVVCLTSRIKPQVKKLAMDLAEYYGFDFALKDDSKWLDSNFIENTSPYKDFYSDLLTESDYDISSFDELPRCAPYGFIVFPDGSFGVAFEMCDHDILCQEKEYEDKSELIKKGGIRIAYVGRGKYEADYLPTKTNHKAIKTAKDLALYYDCDLKLTNATGWLNITRQYKLA
jgi:hypothetical protein